ncbi:MAG TPA: LamG domain-containing protein [Nakamurella sp.]
MDQHVSRRRKLVSLVSVVALTFSGVAFSVVGATAAAADPGPVVQPASTAVTADALPTVQIDGVAWAQAVVGNTVYVGGNFANARPAGAAAGANLTPRSNLLAYNITTGALITSFAPVINGAVQTVSASPDGSRIYIGGDFTTVNGVTKNRVAAFSTATGALITSFSVNIATRVKSIAATNTTVYVGGMFTAANGQPRTRLAAFSAANGALLAWNPGADYTVNALLLTPDQSKVIVGGSFQNLGGAAAYGLGAVDSTNGTLVPWAANEQVRDAGTSSAIMSLSTDGTSVFGTGYVFGPGGNLEGTFSADPNSGTINWIEDCHGDTYGAFSTGGTVYTVSHAHYCGNIGGFPQSDPWSTNERHAIAFTANKTGTIGHDPYGYFDWFGNPSPSITNWFPELAQGKFTGQGQAAWSVTGNSQYVVMGGEFPTVNGTGQQGLVRFAVKPIAPSKRGPMLSGAKFVPSLVSLSSGTVRVAFQTNWDQDDKTLTYKVVRNSNTAAPIFTTTADSTYWNRPSLGFTDTGLTPGATYKYRLYVTDPAGNQVAGDTATITVSNDAAPSAYAGTVLQQGAGTFWRMGEPSGTTAYDWAGYTDGVVGTGVNRGAAGAITGDTNTASTFDGTGNGLVSAPTAITGPDTFTTEAWVNTTSTSGGKIIGFGNQQSGGESGNYDRHTYMDNDGHIFFGVYPGGVATVNTTKSYNDGQWHQIVSSLGPDGMTLYVDGIKAASRSDVTSGQPYTGYWRVGGDNLGGWPNQPASNYLSGSIDEVSIYPTALTKDQVMAQYVASGLTSPIPAVPADTYGAAIYNAQPDLFWRLADTTGDKAADSSA